MSTRLRVALSVVIACAAVLLVASLASVLLVRGNLRTTIDDELERQQAALLGHGESRTIDADTLCARLRADALRQATASGTYLALSKGSTELCRSNLTRPVLAPATHRAGFGVHDLRVQGQDLRVRSVTVGDGLRLDIAHPLDTYHATVQALGAALAGIALLGVLGSVLAGAIAARVATSRLEQMLDGISAAVSDRSMQARVPAVGTRELDTVANEVNVLLTDLRQALAEQRQLVADAAHELRTPLTSLRTNLDVLARLEPGSDEAAPIMRDVRVQVGELADLVGNLVELARQDQYELAANEDVRLDQLVEGVVERARRMHPGLEVEVYTAEATVHGEPELLRRALANVVDNAIKFGDGRVEVSQQGGTVEVRDFGIGFGDADTSQLLLPFHRASTARGVAGSGLGLALVARAVQLHHGAIELEEASPGALVRIVLPQDRSWETLGNGTAGSWAGSAP